MTENQAAAYEWATRCVECGDGPRRHPSEADARRVHEDDVAAERTVPPGERHRLELLRRPIEWEDVTPDA